MQNIDISEKRLIAAIETIAEWSESDPAAGYNRPTFSPSWRAALDYVIEEARKLGCSVKTDPAGNVHARPAGLSWDEPAWLCGSHIDTVPSGGKFDGVVGVVIALELLRTLPGAALELVLFAEEEGTTFGIAMLGSRAWAGTLPGEQIGTLKNRAGTDFASAGKPFGVALDMISAQNFGFPLDRYKGLIEVHVEQGAGLWKKGLSVAVVTTVNGRRQYSGNFMGVANHAGSTAMSDRRDALTGAAEFIIGLEALGKEFDALHPNSVVTAGALTVAPNAVNVIPGRADFMLDFRSPSNELLSSGDGSIRRLLSSIGEKRSLKTQINCFENLPALLFDPGLCDRLRRAGTELGIPLPDASSGALHDSAILAPYMPTAMLFVASKDGISHNPAEFSRPEDIAAAARIVAAAIG
ncbi:MAG: M20 family metallo-hydrolase [Spirochaetia bacterium]|jgi:hydantoinase/carbamoylase family amidase|nr:M20 family metallo-hydrolase [Spirochaetia bacterium]